MSTNRPNDPVQNTAAQRPVDTESSHSTRGIHDDSTVEPSFRDRVRWGPIVAGVVTALTTLLVMTVLGLAIGTTAFEPGETGERTVGTAAAIWGIISAVLAFFLGGWMAGRNALGTADQNGAVNGFLVGAVTIVVMLWMIGAGLGNLMGLAGANIDEISQVTAGQPITAAEGDEAADTIGTAATENYEEARNSAWGTLAGLVVALAAAAAGGALGHPDRSVVRTGAPARRTATQGR